MVEENKGKKTGAVAIQYIAEKDPAPRVTAKGWGLIADQIIKKARENNVPIKEDRDLLQLLSALDVNELIPPELYKVIAEVLAFVYSLNKKMEK